MFPQEIITKKRDKQSLTKAEIEYFIQGVINGTFQDYQTVALLMATLLNGMSDDETSWLTQAMMRSGEIMDLSFIKKAKVDKHSTGGVGDKVSIILAPWAASAGVCVPMISGRGLGHTGGTLDKLQSIPGFRVDLSNEVFRQMLMDVSVSMIGQTTNIAPADKKLYALRDVTGTVESIPLICGSIMSKKLAEGIDSLVLDVKFGLGAFMKTLDRARHLAKSMVAIGHNMNRKVVAYLTNMDQPLGCMVGNSLEIIESIECLKGRGPKDLMELTRELTAQMLVLGHVAKDIPEARMILQQKLDSGEALAKFREIITYQGGNPHVIDDYSILPAARFQADLLSLRDGYIQEIDALKMGTGAMILGAGRKSVQDTIDPAVGITDLRKVGDKVSSGDLLCRVHYNDENKKNEAWTFLEHAFAIGSKETPPIPLIVDILS